MRAQCQSTPATGWQATSQRSRPATFRGRTAQEEWHTEPRPVVAVRPPDRLIVQVHAPKEFTKSLPNPAPWLALLLKPGFNAVQTIRASFRTPKGVAPCGLERCLETPRPLARPSVIPGHVRAACSVGVNASLCRSAVVCRGWFRSWVAAYEVAGFEKAPSCKPKGSV